jgi:hypothetical protein
VGVKLASLTLKAEHRMPIFENILWRIAGGHRDDVTGGGENCILRNFITFSICQAHDV